MKTAAAVAAAAVETAAALTLESMAVVDATPSSSSGYVADSASYAAGTAANSSWPSGVSCLPMPGYQSRARRLSLAVVVVVVAAVDVVDLQIQDEKMDENES